MASVDEVMEDIARFLRKVEPQRRGEYPGFRNDPMVIAAAVSRSAWCRLDDVDNDKARDAIARGIQNGYFAIEKHPECENLILTVPGQGFADALLDQDEKGKAGFRKP